MIESEHSRASERRLLLRIRSKVAALKREIAALNQEAIKVKARIRMRAKRKGE